MKNVRVLAQDIMDAYYQNFKEGNEDFFDHDYFIRQCHDTHASILRDEYIAQYRMLRMEMRHMRDMVEFSFDWLKHEDVELKKNEVTGYYHAEIKGKVFQFPFDQSNVGYQMVTPVKRGDCDLIRTTQHQNHLDKFLPETTVVFWHAIMKNTLAFDKDCCKNVRVHYVDSDAMDIPDGLANTIMDVVLNRMFGARNGRGVVDVTNDSNPNAKQQTETNKDTM